MLLQSFDCSTTRIAGKCCITVERWGKTSLVQGTESMICQEIIIIKVCNDVRKFYRLGYPRNGLRQNWSNIVWELSNKSKKTTSYSKNVSQTLCMNTYTYLSSWNVISWFVCFYSTNYWRFSKFFLIVIGISKWFNWHLGLWRSVVYWNTRIYLSIERLTLEN